MEERKDEQVPPELDDSKARESWKKLSREDLEDITTKYWKVCMTQGARMQELLALNKKWEKYAEHLKKELSKYSNPGEVIDDLFSESKDDFYFTDVGGLDPVISRVRRIQYGLSHPEHYTAMGIPAPRGLLLYGPPGCGKTMIAKAMANELDIYFLELNITKFGTKYVNESAGNLSSILKACNKRYTDEGKKVLVCLDEAEGILSPRGHDSTGELDRCKTVFLNFMDGHEQNEGLIFVAATNRYDLIDEAVKRPGRFNISLEIPRPDLAGVEDVFTKQMEYVESKAGRTIYESCDPARLAMLFYPKGPSGADVRHILTETAERIIQHYCELDADLAEWAVAPGDIRICQGDLEQTIREYNPGSRRNVSSRPIGFGAHDK
ncbi:ATP-binding protein [Candidatus Woesearchaeota archaeon]|nr:ATP-binding protein [Candidatus Woesearchaeota archaeon]